MAATWVQTKGAQTAAGTTVAVSLSGVGAGNAIANGVCVFQNIATSLTTSTPSATWTNAVADFQDGSLVDNRGDATPNTASGAWTVNGNVASSGAVTGAASEFTGVKTSGTFIGVSNHGTSAATTVQPGSITPTAGSALYTFVEGNGGGSTAATIDSSFTVDDTAGAEWNQANQGAGAAHKDNVAASAVNPTWTSQWSSTTTMGALIFELLAAAAAAGLTETHMDCGQQSEMGSAI